MKQILTIFAIVLMMVSCSQPSQQRQPKFEYSGPETGYAEILVDYRIHGTSGKTWVKKIAVDDHEYLMFGSGLANPPTVIHSENCPCKRRKPKEV